MKQCVIRLIVALWVFNVASVEAQPTPLKDSLNYWSGTSAPVAPAIAYSRWTGYVTANPSVDQLTFRNLATGLPATALSSDLPVSTATQTALNGKQSSLVAGTNISIVGTTISSTATIPSKVFSTPNFSNSTTATQLSSTRDAIVQYSYNATVSIGLLAGQTVTAILEYADNSGMSTNLVSLDQQLTSNSGVLGLTQANTLKVTGTIPAGKYRRVRFTTAGSGATAPSSIVSSQEVLQ